MNNDLQIIFNKILELNSLLNSKTSPNIQKDITENLHQLSQDLKVLKNIAQNAKKTNVIEEKELHSLIANTNASLVDILSDLEDIYDDLTRIAKNCINQNK